MRSDASAPLNGNASALLDVAQMNEADRLSALGGVAGIVLMENAGAAVADAVRGLRPQGLVVVLCGPGNNGGDGFVAARLLAQAGRHVRLALSGARENLKGDARHHSNLWRGAVETLAPDVLRDADIVVDALFGSGLRRPLGGAALATLEAAHRSAVPIVAVDVPSGVAGDTGGSLGAVPCTVTVTFFRKKPGHLLAPGRALCGRVVVADIGTPDSVWKTITSVTFENTPALWRDAIADQGIVRDGKKADRPSSSNCVDRITASECHGEDFGSKAMGDVLAFARAASRDRGAIVVVREGDGTGELDPVCVGTVHPTMVRGEPTDGRLLEWSVAADGRQAALVIAAADGRAAITVPEHLSSESGSVLLPETLDPFLAACAALYRPL
jgi:hydroxyethylthiazole kinase-like uncharacterized protein yjeF